MILEVNLERFCDEAKNRLKTKEVYLDAHRGGSIITAANAEATILVSSRSSLAPEEVKKKLEDAGLHVHEGSWISDNRLPSTADGQPLFIAAVAYKSGENKPGLWIDAYADLPTPAEVLNALYDEFRQTGELADVSFEEFLRLAYPNVVIVSPTEIARYIEAKQDPC